MRYPVLFQISGLHADLVEEIRIVSPYIWDETTIIQYRNARHSEAILSLLYF